MFAQLLSRVGLLQMNGLLCAELICPCYSPGKNTGVGCHALLQGIFPNPGTKPLSSTSPAVLAGRFFSTKPPGKPKKEVRQFKEIRSEKQ